MVAAPLQTPQSLRPRARFGRYELVRRIAAGGMGEVWEGRDVEVGRVVAIKFPHPSRLQSPVAFARFRKEAHVTGRLDSEHCVATFDVCMEGERPYIVMEYVRGDSLRSILEACGPLALPRAVNLVLQVCEGLSAAHRAGIIHRDLKPENLMVSFLPHVGERLKILDFGIIRFEGEPGTTARGAVLGTPAYMAPEQVRGEPDQDARVDVYAVGALLFELLTGSKPYRAHSRDELFYQIMTEPPPRARALRPHLPPELDDVIARCLAKRRDERPASVEVLTESLRAFSWSSSDDAATGAATIDAPVVVDERPASPSSRWWSAVTLCVAALAFGVGYLSGTKESDPVEVVTVASLDTDAEEPAPAPSAVPAAATSSVGAASVAAAGGDVGSTRVAPPFVVRRPSPPAVSDRPAVKSAESTARVHRDVERASTMTSASPERTPGDAPTGFEPNPYPRFAD